MTAEAFWNFSLDRYARHGVSEICLKLQDEVSADVNIVLLCLWCGQDGRPLSREQLLQLTDGEAGKWHRDIVLSLRSARQAMKGRAIAGEAQAVEDFRDQIKAIEIESEKFEQRSLAAAVTGFAISKRSDLPRRTRATVTMESLERYLELLAPDAPQRHQEALTGLVENCIE